MPATPQGNGGERCAKAEQGSRTSATETVPGELGGVLPMERAGETEGAAGVEKRTRFTAPTLDKESPGAQEGGEWSPHLGFGAFGGLDPDVGNGQIVGHETAKF